jgi:hypothetical protein
MGVGILLPGHEGTMQFGVLSLKLSITSSTLNGINNVIKIINNYVFLILNSCLFNVHVVEKAPRQLLDFMTYLLLY